METHTSHGTLEGIVREYSTPLSILAAGALIIMTLYYGPPQRGASAAKGSEAQLQEAVLPAAGAELPITWGDLGARLVEVGVINAEKLAALYESRGGFPTEYRKLIERNANDKIVMTNWNAGYLLNLFWALGLANENPILADKAEMMNPSYGGAGNFASTGGWTLAQGDAMNHYNMHRLVVLTESQQAMVDRVSRGIFRPCCGNSAHFPDCNHGMAMLGLLELMAAQGADEETMYKVALAANAYWFPETYLTIAAYMQERGVRWADVSPREVLGANYSSASGYQNIMSQVKNLPQSGSAGGCSA